MWYISHVFYLFWCVFRPGGQLRGAGLPASNDDKYVERFPRLLPFAPRVLK
jgi:hypothetical protein